MHLILKRCETGIEAVDEREGWNFHWAAYTERITNSQHYRKVSVPDERNAAINVPKLTNGRFIAERIKRKQIANGI